MPPREIDVPHLRTFLVRYHLIHAPNLIRLCIIDRVLVPIQINRGKDIRRLYLEIHSSTRSGSLTEFYQQRYSTNYASRKLPPQ
jgi:hypothetical protein